ncbi:MAG TPA: phosphatidylglycerol lysyltransferase domain-containing protein, partial [Microlunatus sp.]|nr:phosphatidylglycerol lysyltransferase domain-containing protein [Microlunatus sp.]
MSALAPVEQSGEERQVAPHRQRRGFGAFLKDDRWPDFFATGMLLAGVLVLVVSFIGPLRRYFAREYDLVSALTIPIVPGLVYAALLLVMAVALRRRLRAAWWLLVVWWVVLPELGRILFLITGRGSLLDKTLTAIGLVLMGFVLVVLIRSRSQFSARRVPGSLGLAILVFVVGGVAMLVLGTWLTLRFGTTTDISDAMGHIMNVMLVDLGRFGGIDQVRSPLWVRFVVGLFGAAVVLSAAYLLFRPPKHSKELSVADEAQVRTLLREYGDLDSLGYFATRRDKAVVWDTGDPTTARAGVSYRAIGSVSLASGNPLGDPERWPEAIEAWRLEARR